MFYVFMIYAAEATATVSFQTPLFRLSSVYMYIDERVLVAATLPEQESSTNFSVEFKKKDLYISILVPS